MVCIPDIENIHLTLQYGIENARPSLQSQITKLWRELSLKLIQKMEEKSASSVYATCGLSLLWRKSDLNLVENITFSVLSMMDTSVTSLNSGSDSITDSSDYNPLMVFTPKLILQMNSGQLKLENLHQISSIGMVQSLLLSIGAYATSAHTNVIATVMNYMLGQITGIWDVYRPCKRRDSFEVCLGRFSNYKCESYYGIHMILELN